MIIGIAGIAGHGKGTAADALINMHGFKKMSLADPVKDVTAAVFGWDRHLLEGDTQESRDFREREDPYWSTALERRYTPRIALQEVGTEAFRHGIHSDVWVHAIRRKIVMAGGAMADIVIPDVRFANEVSMIRGSGGVIWRVSMGSMPEWYAHASALMSGYMRRANLQYPTVPEDIRNAMAQKFPDAHESEWTISGLPADLAIHNDGTVNDLCDKVECALNRLRSAMFMANTAEPSAERTPEEGSARA